MNWDAIGAIATVASAMGVLLQAFVTHFELAPVGRTS